MQIIPIATLPHKHDSTDLISNIFQKNGKVTYLNMAERGVGKNRNAVLQNATADICVFADDDMTFVDGYPQIVERAFSTIWPMPEAM